jgi:hypothetical protein
VDPLERHQHATALPGIGDHDVPLVPCDAGIFARG